jgi:hypothetical protein
MQVAAEQTTEVMPLLCHGALQLPSVRLDCYNLEFKDQSGFIGDRASKSAFAQLLDKWRNPLRRRGDPFGRGESAEINRKKLDALLADGPPGAAAALVASIEEFAQQLADVIRHFLKQKCWRETERIVVGGGMSESRIGKIAIACACLILNAEERDVELVPIGYGDPDEAALIGSTHLVPAWSTSAAPTSAPAWWNCGSRTAAIFPRRASNGSSAGATAMRRISTARTRSKA